MPQDRLDAIYEMAREARYLRHWLEKRTVYQAARHDS
jgi:hypothetical protein